MSPMQGVSGDADQKGVLAERRRPRRVRAYPPIVNVGRLRIDWPTRDRSPANLMKFAGFVAVLLGLFALLYAVQARWLMNINARQQTPGWEAIKSQP